MTVNEYVKEVKEVKKYIRRNVVKDILSWLWGILIYLPFTIYFSVSVIRYPSEVPLWLYIMAGVIFTTCFMFTIFIPWSSYHITKIRWVIKHKNSIENHFGNSIWIDIMTKDGEIIYQIKPKTSFTMNEETCIDAMYELINTINS